MSTQETQRKIIIDGARQGFVHAASQAAQSVSPDLIAIGLLKGALGFGEQHLTPVQLVEILEAAVASVRQKFEPAND